MRSFISQGRRIDIIILALFIATLSLLASCQSDKPSMGPRFHALLSQKAYQDIRLVEFQAAGAQKISVVLAITPEEMTQGLSNVRDNEMADDQGMLFFYLEDGARRFWMPDTYINLDIFFLSKDFVVLDVARDVPAHAGRNEPPAIAVTQTVNCRHVLELKSSSKLAKEIKQGDKLKWTSSPGPDETESKIRLSR